MINATVAGTLTLYSIYDVFFYYDVSNFPLGPEVFDEFLFFNKKYALGCLTC